jgi:hypothetical protein
MGLTIRHTLLSGELSDCQSSTERRHLHRQSRAQQLPRPAGFLHTAAHVGFFRADHLQLGEIDAA